MMNINYKESQIDFLSQVAGKGESPVRPRYMAAQISLSLENLVILTIVAIMLVIFSFSMGIERGKKVALASPAQSVDANDVGSVASAAAGVSKVEKASEKKDVKDKADVQKIKAVVVSSQTIAKNKLSDALSSGVDVGGGTPKASVTGGAYTLQVASYKNQKPAQREADNLKQKGFHDVYILPKGAYVIVCVGNFQRKEDASDVKRQLKSRYQDFVVRRL